MRDCLKAVVNYCKDHDYNFAFYADRSGGDPDYCFDGLKRSFGEAAGQLWAYLDADASTFVDVLIDLEETVGADGILFFEDYMPDEAHREYVRRLSAQSNDT